MMASEEDLTLGQLLDKALDGAETVLSAELPNDGQTQSLLHLTLSHLDLAQSLIDHLSLLSPNETLEDINTADLRCLLVDGLRGELETLARCRGTEERKVWLTRAQTHLRAFKTQVDQYEVVPKKEREIWAPENLKASDMGRKREMKISRFKKEKELKGKLEELKSHRQKIGAGEGEYDDEHSRPLFISLITFHYLRALSELDSISAELDILKDAIPTSEASASSPSSSKDDDSRAKKREGGSEVSWRLDPPLRRAEDGRLLSDDGKVLRPFVILPSKSSASATRLRLQQEVFQPSHNLPTMTIDEFLESEYAMGNVLQGGGPKNSKEVEEERAKVRAEGEDDTLEGYEKEEEALREKREWDEYTDVHRRGEGNRLGRS
ncbi:TAP42-like protein [Atractiella rhizophila]|nr:TAP42-like protein [Atractiella rhizophila]